jgi:hypothetical protein
LYKDVPQYLQQTPPFPKTLKQLPLLYPSIIHHHIREKAHTLFHNEGLHDAATDGDDETPPPPGRGGGGIAVATGCCCWRCTDFSVLDTEEVFRAGGMYCEV